jgi:hypothetical protein
MGRFVAGSLDHCASGAGARSAETNRAATSGRDIGVGIRGMGWAA